MLNSQAIALNAIFAEMARRAALNVGEYIDAAERYMRLALKEQGQSRATVETLATLKNPPVVFARQANIASGPLQVNNGVAHDGSMAPTPRARELHSEQSKLLGVCDGERSDFGAKNTTGGTESDLATVGAVNRSENRGGKNQDCTQCLEGWSPSDAARTRAGSHNPDRDAGGASNVSVRLSALLACPGDPRVCARNGGPGFRSSCGGLQGSPTNGRAGTESRL